MPVDQTGENILFVVDQGRVEAHIQIQYLGDAERFAWVLPLPAVPDSISIGSGPLFVNLLNGTVPSFGYTNACGGTQVATVEGGGGAVESPTERSSAPLTVITKVVGAFEVSLLVGGTAEEVIAWLEGNGYEQIPEAEPIFEDYVNQGHVFAALKLTGGAGIDEIHPIIVRYPGDEPCVPLKLTSVAAVKDMGVRAFFLGSERVVPSNYKHITLNPVALDWSNFADNYMEVVSNAVDSPVADGQAFITEYAGASSVVSRANIYSSNWDAEAFLDVAAEDVVSTLEQQGFLNCSAASCTFNHPLIEPMLEKYLPPPAGVDAQGFYSCPRCYPAAQSLSDFDRTAFAAELIERVIVPGRDANALLDAHPYLTRLFTTISPDEMTLDPLFHEQVGLDPVNNNRLVRRAFGAGATSAYQVTDDWIVELSRDGEWPEFAGEMPFALSIEEYAPGEDPVELVDNSDAIEEALDASNEEQDYDNVCSGFPTVAVGAAGADAGPSTTSTGTDGTDGTNSSSNTGTGGTSGETKALRAEGGACSCRIPTGSRTPGLFWWTLAVGGLVLARRVQRS